MSIVFDHVYFQYPNGYISNEDLDFTIAQDECVAIIGQNGAGKSTAAKLMNRLLLPTQGDVLIDGINTREKTTAQIAKYVGYVFQNPDDQIFNKTVNDEVQYILKKRQLPAEEIQRRTEIALQLTGLSSLKRKNPFDLPLPVRKFLTIASVIASSPHYMILDEPTAGLDSRGIALLESMIAQLHHNGMGIITITHNMEFVAHNFQRVVVMANKRICFDGLPQILFSNNQLIAQSGIKKPDITLIAEMAGIKHKILSIDDLVNYLTSSPSEL
ncbi:ABC transporter ATP-binding protein [Edwardsiella hoshinae]|uniref:ABC transporter ATP-binding protein n=1 Tax=Edwardsiella hoshinae TaxID=93378 RepID=A0A376DHN6_9GAMM|nr:ABC transporter ATP-binding protein [Edwardsiella hoshinae]AOV97339.1 ABC transporter ATP-binding protein [Edwardsiella hoshinae]QPR26711.1 ABC transporter ATP-binding protein [Edwardsiella hoshinae]STC89632.1 Energy-coupling factor transporter ATP-binding protein EcfA1 [Edwardsiella hoshinae]